MVVSQPACWLTNERQPYRTFAVFLSKDLLYESNCTDFLGSGRDTDLLSKGLHPSVKVLKGCRIETEYFSLEGGNSVEDKCEYPVATVTWGSKVLSEETTSWHHSFSAVLVVLGTVIAVLQAFLICSLCIILKLNRLNELHGSPAARTLWARRMVTHLQKGGQARL